MVLVTEIDAASKKGHKVIRGTAEKLIGQLTEDPESLDSTSLAPVASATGPLGGGGGGSSIVDPTYVEDFLLTYRTFTSPHTVMRHLFSLMEEGKTMDRVTRVLLIWVNNHFPDFEADPDMMEQLEKFEGEQITSVTRTQTLITLT